MPKPIESQWFSHAELIGDIGPLFVGRARELKFVHDSLAKRGVVVIRGERGSGKTSLLFKIRDDMRSRFSQIVLLPAQQLFGRSVDEELRARVRLPTRERVLVIVDDAHAFSLEQIGDLARFRRTNPTVQFVVATGVEAPVPRPFVRDAVISLGGLSEAEYFKLLALHLKAASADDGAARALWLATSGKPLFAEIAGRTIRDRMLSWQELYESLSGFHHSGILDASGQPFESSTSVPQQLVIAVENTNRKILEQLRKDPRGLWQLGPRKFEEIVAELLAENGYQVELTPLSGDGGFDMYAARKDVLGSFLFLVECKRYIPPQKVGVNIVRSLYGVVHQKNANAGIVATTSFFTKGALEFEQERRYQIHLSDYLALQQWLKHRK